MYTEYFSEKLKNARKNSGFSQIEVAKEMEIDQSTLANYELGKREPNIEMIAKLATFYHVTTDWLLGIGQPLTEEEYENKLTEEKERKEILKKLK